MTAQPEKPITLKEAAGLAGVSPDTVARWCKRYGIGQQLHPHAPWHVDPKGAAIVASGDAAALLRYQQATQKPVELQIAQPEVL